MKELVLSALVGLNIDCIPLQEFALKDNWKKEICEVFEDYENVTLRAVRNVVKPVNKSFLSSGKLDISKPAAGRVVVKRLAKLEDGVDVLITTFYSVSAMQNVWVAKRNIDKNKVIAQHDVVLEKRNVLAFTGIKTTTSDVVGAYTVRRFAKGQIIFVDYLQTRPVIAEGAEINALLVTDGIRISVRGVALENGYFENETLKVRLIETGTIKSGKVKDGETVLLDI